MGGCAVDPLAERFVAQDRRPTHLGAVDAETLSPFLRTLLISDGTVTRFIEAYQLERVDTVRLDQVHFASRGGHEWLAVESGAPVALRRVFLRGRDSDTIYAYATTLVALDRMPKSVLARLELKGQSLGRVLNDAKIETRRETLWYGWESDLDVPDPLRHLAQPWLTRAYRIVHRGQPMALVTERFPGAADGDRSQTAQPAAAGSS